MTDSLEARRAALDAIISIAAEIVRLQYAEDDNGQELIMSSTLNRWANGLRTQVDAARGVESRPPVDVEAALDGLTRYDTDWENGNSIAAKDYGKYVLHSEVLDLLRTVTTRED